MSTMIAGVALAAGAGTRLAPITDSIPKPCCEVGARSLLDLALDRLETVTSDLAVNAHHHTSQIARVAERRALVREERPVALGTAGAIANLLDWVDGRAVAIVNADTWCPGGLRHLTAGWEGTTTRVLVPGGGAFGPRAAIVGTLIPWRAIRDLEVAPTGLYEVVWQHEHRDGRLEVVPHAGPWMDCGTPTRLWQANMAAIGDGNRIADTADVLGVVQQSAVGERAVVAGTLTSSVVFAGARVEEDETLDRTIRWADGSTQHSLVVSDAEAPRR